MFKRAFYIKNEDKIIIPRQKIAEMASSILLKAENYMLKFDVKKYVEKNIEIQQNMYIFLIKSMIKV